MFSKDTFCALPWASIQINPSGNFKICCFSGNDKLKDHGVGKDEKTGDVMNILTHSFDEALNSDLHKELRLFQSQNKRHPVCRVCWDKEDANRRLQKDQGNFDSETIGGISYRIGRTFTHMKDQENGVNLEDAGSIMNHDGSIDNIPIALDIRFSNLCNSKCIQCEPQYSSLWYSDHMALTGDNKFWVGPKQYQINAEGNKLKNDFVRWHDSPIWWERFETIKHRLLHVYITGGEPFLQPAHDEFLDRLISCGQSKKIRLVYDTNLTVINEKILKKLDQFKEVRLGISVDDTEKRYELIRYPSSWKKLNENISLLKKHPNMFCTITSCVGIFDVYAPMRVVPHFQNLGFDKFSFRLLRSPESYDLKWYPREAKDKIIRAYDECNLKIQHKAMTVGYIKNTYNTQTEEECAKGIQRFVARSDALDKLRGTDWKATFPEVVELLKEYL
jgi:MoaA/NifB/PqqE/SkfB family radical SAM enzyme